jgi:hypothetical protein
VVVRKDSYVRGVLGPVAELATRTGVAIFGVTHLSKQLNPRATAPMLYRALGSIAFVAAARIVLAARKDPRSPSGDRRFLTGVKSNLAALSPALAYRIVPPGRIEWEPRVVDGLDPETLRDQAGELAERVLALLDASPNGLTREELSHAFGRNVEASKIAAACSRLAEPGRARCETERRGKGRPSQRWLAVSLSTKETNYNKWL